MSMTFFRDSKELSARGSDKTRKKILTFTLSFEIPPLHTVFITLELDINFSANSPKPRASVNS